MKLEFRIIADNQMQMATMVGVSLVDFHIFSLRMNYSDKSNSNIYIQLFAIIDNIRKEDELGYIGPNIKLEMKNGGIEATIANPKFRFAIQGSLTQQGVLEISERDVKALEDWYIKTCLK